MDSKYLYSAARIKALETTLLTEGQLERLLGAKDVEEGYKVLHETFLGEYLTQPQKTPLSRVLRKSVTLAKQLLVSIAPEPKLLDYLWIRYDFYNLKTILKGKRSNLSDEDILEKCYFASKYEPKALLLCVARGDFSGVDEHLASAYEEAKSAKEVWRIDISMNTWYFRTIHEWAQKEDNGFLREYVALTVDLFNLRTRLRVLAFGDATPLPELFISGGTLLRQDMETREQVFEAFARFGGEGYWKEALSEYEEKRSFAALERLADDFVLTFLRSRTVDVFSPVTLFAFFWARRNNAQLIQTVMTAKEVGTSEKEIRYVLRRLYT